MALNDEKYTSAKCSVCVHPQRDEIEEKLMSGLHTQKAIAEEYHISEPTLSNHKNKHLISMMKDSLKRIIFERIQRNELKDASFTEIVSTLKYIEENDKKIEIGTAKTTEQLINEYLGFDPKYASPLHEYIHINPEQYEKFADFLRKQTEDIEICVSPGAYKKYKEQL